MNINARELAYQMADDIARKIDDACCEGLPGEIYLGVQLRMAHAQSVLRNEFRIAVERFALMLIAKNGKHDV